jgi:ketosteroid isomerase-like protein
MARPFFQHRRIRSGISLMAIVLTAAVLLPRPLLANGPHPKRNDQFKHQVEKLEEDWRAAELSGDVDAMDKLLSDDYVGITMSGQVVTKMQQLDRIRKRSLVLTKLALDDVKVKLIGTSAAIVTSLAEVEGTNDGVPMHGTFRSTRVYSRLPSGAWKITNFEATRVGQGPSPDGRHNRSNSPRPDDGTQPQTPQ